MNINKSQVLKVCKKLKRDLISYKFLAAGAHNLNYLLNTKQGKLVLKIDNSAQRVYLKREYLFLSLLKEPLGPEVYLFDSSKKIISRDFLVEEFIEGEHPKKDTDEFIKAMAKWYKRLHSYRFKRFPFYIKRSKYYSMKESYWYHCLKEYQKFKHVASKNIREQIDPLYVKTSKIIKNNENLFKKRKYTIICQGDPCPSNLFYKNGKVRAIDWEFAKFNLEEWDITFFVWIHDLNKRQEKLFLKTYGYPNTAIKKKQYDIIHLLNGLSMISWRLERLDLINKKKISRKNNTSRKKDIMRGWREDIPKVKKMLDLWK
ncbi:MAG: aminoglycoside phosphotransferase family protein [archaeon]